MKLKTLMIATGLSALFSFQALAGWVEIDNGQWAYEQDGNRISNEWIEDQGSWYYLNADGIMLADTTQHIDGTDYAFDASGRWIEQTSARTGVNAGVYTNADFNYSLQIPADMPYTLQDNGNLDMGSGITLINIGHVTYTADDISVSERAEAFVTNFKNDTANDFPFQYSAEVRFGEMTFTRHHFYSSYYDASVDLYIGLQEHGFMSIFTGYVSDTEPTVQNILRTIRTLP